jgi:hypothetical protein
MSENHYVISIKALLQKYLSNLTNEDVEHVNHLISVDELEMALEALLLSIYEKRVILLDSDKVILKSLSIELGLDKETVFRSDFWNIIQPILH